MNRNILIIICSLFVSSCATYKPLEETVIARGYRSFQMTEITPAANVVVVEERQSKTLLRTMHPDYEAPARARKLIVRSPHYLTISFPSAIFLNSAPQKFERRQKYAGIFALGAGYQYQYNPHNYVAFQTDIGVGIGTTEYPSSSKRGTNSNFSLSHNHRLRMIAFGYGLNMGWTKWNEKPKFNWFEPDPETKEWKDSQGNSLDYIRSLQRCSRYWTAGLAFSSHLRLGEGVEFGAVYRPSAFRIVKANRWKYEHSIYIDLRLIINPGRKVYAVF